MQRGFVLWAMRRYSFLAMEAAAILAWCVFSQCAAENETCTLVRTKERYTSFEGNSSWTNASMYLNTTESSNNTSDANSSATGTWNVSVSCSGCMLGYITDSGQVVLLSSPLAQNDTVNSSLGTTAKAYINNTNASTNKTVYTNQSLRYTLNATFGLNRTNITNISRVNAPVQVLCIPCELHAEIAWKYINATNGTNSTENVTNLTKNSVQKSVNCAPCRWARWEEVVIEVYGNQTAKNTSEQNTTANVTSKIHNISNVGNITANASAPQRQLKLVCMPGPNSELVEDRDTNETTKKNTSALVPSPLPAESSPVEIRINNTKWVDRIFDTCAFAKREHGDNFLHFECVSSKMSGAANRLGRCLESLEYCAPCPEGFSTHGDYTVLSDCVVTLAFQVLAWMAVCVTSGYTLVRSWLTLRRVYHNRLIWAGYFAPIRDTDGGKRLTSKVRNILYMVYNHDDGKPLILICARSVILFLAVAMPKCIWGGLLDIGKSNMLTISISVVGVLNVFLLPELSLLVLSNFLRKQLPQNPYLFHTIDALHKAVDGVFNSPRFLFAGLAFFGPCSLLVINSWAFLNVDSYIIPIKQQVILEELYAYYVAAQSSAVAISLLYMGVVGTAVMKKEMNTLRSRVLEACMDIELESNASDEADMMRTSLTFATQAAKTCIRLVLIITVISACWYTNIAFVPWSRKRVSYGIVTTVLLMDGAIIYIIKYCVTAAPHRVNGDSSRRYVKLGDNVRGILLKGAFSDDANGTASGLEAKLVNEANRRAAAQLQSQEPHGVLYACTYYLNCWCWKKKAKVRPGGRKRWSILDEPATKRMMQKLDLSEKVIEKFLKLFKSIDKDKGGAIEIDEFNAYFRLPHSPFASRAFNAMDRDGSKQIDFREFVSCIWNFCSLTKSGLMVFAFLLYDADLSKSLERGELALLLRDVWGEHWQSNPRAMYLLAKIDADDSGEVSLPEWLMACKKHPLLLAPAFKVQNCLRQRSFGASFWEKVAQSRSQSVEGQVKSIMEFVKFSVVKLPESSRTLRERHELDEQMKKLVQQDQAKQERANEAMENRREKLGAKEKSEQFEARLGNHPK